VGNADANRLHLPSLLHISCNSRFARPKCSRKRNRNQKRTEPSMIVCSCNVLRESQVREIARDGVRCEREAYQRLGCRPQCGQCLPYARQLVREESSRVAS
jgi:bacterioferritin-associated ferredoxin